MNEIVGSKIIKKEDREKQSALELAEKTINSLGDIQKKLDDREITQNEFFTTVSETIKDAIKELSEAVQQRPGITVETDPIAQIVNQALETFSSTLVEIKTACENIKLPDIKNEFNPDVKVPAPVVTIDITPLEILLRDELPKAFKGLLDGLKFPKPASNKNLEDQLKEVIDLLGKIKDKKSPMFIGGGGGGGSNVPIITTPGGLTAVPVANTDGSPIGGGGGGGGDATAANQVLEIARLVDIFTRLNDGSTVVALDAPTLAALETINAIVSGTVALDAGTLAALENIIVTGTVALDAPTLAALENISAVVSGTVALDAGTLAALENVTATVSGTVELGATSLAALENITATVSGAIALDAPTLAALENINAIVTATDLDIRNLVFATDKVDTTGSTVALDAPTLAALESITAAVTGTVELGATTLAALENITATVSGTVALDSATLAALENISAIVSGTVALDSATLAALENIIVTGTVALDSATLAALESITAVVTGTVALDSATLAALESITAVVSGAVNADIRVGGTDVSTSNPVPNQDVLKSDLLPYAKFLIADDVIDPAPGKRIRLIWAQVIPNSDNTSSNAVTIRMTIGGVLTDVYAVYALGRSAVFTGDVDTNVIIDLANAQPVSVNMHYREII